MKSEAFHHLLCDMTGDEPMALCEALVRGRQAGFLLAPSAVESLELEYRACTACRHSVRS